jgi:uncharacterized peroxidase-related enzyme
LLKDDELLAAVESDWATAGLSPQRQAMLAFALKLTVTPGQMTETDAEMLTAVGFTDRDILDIVEVTAYFAYVNRLADGLGVEPNESWYES